VSNAIGALAEVPISVVHLCHLDPAAVGRHIASLREASAAGAAVLVVDDLARSNKTPVRISPNDLRGIADRYRLPVIAITGSGLRKGEQDVLVSQPEIADAILMVHQAEKGGGRRAGCLRVNVLSAHVAGREEITLDLSVDALPSTRGPHSSSTVEAESVVKELLLPLWDDDAGL
jgi:hypothetical protein